MPLRYRDEGVGFDRLAFQPSQYRAEQLGWTLGPKGHTFYKERKPVVEVPRKKRSFTYKRPKYLMSTDNRGIGKYGKWKKNWYWKGTRNRTWQPAWTDQEIYRR